MGLLSSQLLKSVEWLDDSQDTLVYRYPMSGKKIMFGSKLTVRESQVAVFVNKGKVADVFEPGMYTLSTSNLPIITGLLSLPFGFKSPFFAEVYFVNTKQFTNQKWGTSNPIAIRDKEFGTIRVRGYGNYSFRVQEAYTFLKELFGTNSKFTTQDISDHLRSQIVTGISDLIASSGVSAIDLASKLEEFSGEAQTKLADEFLNLGLRLVGFNIENLSFPEEVEKALDMRASMGVMSDKMDTFVKYQTANALRDAANNQSGGAGLGASLGAGLAMGGVFKGAVEESTGKKSGGATIGGKCSKCKTELPANVKFCTNCGEKVGKTFCIECGSELPSGAKFCSNCGKKQK